MHVSSAYKFETVSFNDYGKLLIWITKGSGPRIEPCGTPHVNKLSSEKTPSVDTKIFYLKDRI